jgi:hypothetical protein
MSGKHSTVRAVAYYRHATLWQDAALVHQMAWAHRAAPAARAVRRRRLRSTPGSRQFALGDADEAPQGW